MDNIDVRNLSVQWLRSQIGLVRQEPVLFNNTVRENIRYGREGATDAEVRAAAQQANAHYFITKLPKVLKYMHTEVTLVYFVRHLYNLCHFPTNKLIL